MCVSRLLCVVATVAVLLQLLLHACPATQPGLLLRGWRDRGSCFQLRASSRLSPELLSLFEVEVLLLAPSHWAGPSLGLFGLQLTGLQVWLRFGAGKYIEKSNAHAGELWACLTLHCVFL
jgi:hypothetical protein